MGLINHGETTKGNLHAMIDLEYPTAADRIAGTNEVSGKAMSADLIYHGAIQLDTSSLWVLLNNDPITWREI
jgi:hypothetical protein